MTGMRAILCALVLSVCLTQTSAGKIYVRWTYREVPAVKMLGVETLVLRWNEDAKQVLAAIARGYHVYLETSVEKAAATAESAAKNGAEGIILEAESSKLADADDTAQTLRTEYPRLKILVLSPGGHQPDMRGWLVFNKNGILQVSSPTSQPWLDSNLALVRYQQAYQKNQLPLYTFSWDMNNPLSKDRGPHPEDYALAVAEAGAFDADLILEVYDRQQKGLVEGDQETLADWDLVKRALAFYGQEHALEGQAAACVAVLSENYESTYEPLNLMARHNIPYRLLRPSDVKPADLAPFDVVIVFAELRNALREAVSSFAEAGGVAVLVNLTGPYPWEADPLAKTRGPSTAYSLGKGRIIELHESIVDPETFARDVRQLMVKDRIPVSLWNSLTTLATSYPDERSGDVTVELVNYAQESMQVQVRVKGNFRSVKYQTLEHSSWETLNPSILDGFTEFVVPGIVIGGRVRLSNPGSRAR